jgi:hypothetical protein
MKIAGMFLSLSVLFSSLAFGADQKPVATCKDGKVYSNDSGRHSGACRGHGGVAKWEDGAPVKGKGAHGSYK